MHIDSKNVEDNTVSYFNDKRAELSIMPSILIIGLDGHNQMLGVLQEHMDETVKPKRIICSLMDSLAVKDTAIEELEYHCLGLLEENSMGHMYHWFEPMVQYIDHVGREIYHNLLLHNAYLEGKLVYTLQRICSSGLYFQRKDLFEKQVNEELRCYEHKSLQGQHWPESINYYQPHFPYGAQSSGFTHQGHTGTVSR